MHFLIENMVFPETQKKLVDTLCEMRVNHTVWDASVNPPLDGRDSGVFVFGRIDTVMHLLAGRYRYQLWFGPKFDYSYLMGHLDSLLNEVSMLLPVKSLYRMLMLEGDDEIDVFYRSNSAFKKLVGAVRSNGQLLVDLKESNLFNEELIVLSEEKDIKDEYRLIIRAEHKEEEDAWVYKIITSSHYMSSGNVITDGDELPESYYTKVLDILDRSTFHPYPMFALDVTIDKDDKIKIIEANSLNTCNLYTCDIRKVIESILEV